MTASALLQNVPGLGLSSAFAESVFAGPSYPISVAVSGGSDSLALLAWSHLKASETETPLNIFTVDHQLRPESKSEADFVCAVAAALDRPFQRLIWQAPKAGQQVARRERHRLLANAARAAGAQTVLLGHTFDDVVETFLIRRRRRRDLRRTAGPVFLSPSPIWPEGREVALVRPLLWQRRHHLQAELMRSEWSWCSDPSNDTQAYERSRVRQFLRRQPRLASISERVVRAELAERHTFDVRVGAFLSDKQCVSVEPDGLIRVALSWNVSDVELSALSVLIRVASGSDKQMSGPAIARALEALSSKGSRVTIGGAWLQKTGTGLWIGRDPGEAVRDVRGGLWDGRYEPCAGAPAFATPHILVRDSLPVTGHWTSIVPERLKFEASLLCKLTSENM
ncbi:MAG: tRNA lysidine(34) synthetase TilS, partial [Pseudomonadota bacterium]